MKSSSEISTKQEKLIPLLLTERTIDEACRKAKVAVKTYWRWMQTEVFLAEYRKARRGILENTIAKIQSLSFQAIDALEKNLTCENPAAEIRAAQIVLEQAIRGMEVLDIENRLEYLEATVTAKEKTP